MGCLALSIQIGELNSCPRSSLTGWQFRASLRVVQVRIILLGMANANGITGLSGKVFFLVYGLSDWIRSFGKKLFPVHCIPSGRCYVRLQMQRHTKGFSISKDDLPVALACQLGFQRGARKFCFATLFETKQIHWWRKLNCCLQTLTLRMFGFQADERILSRLEIYRLLFNRYLLLLNRYLVLNR